MSQETMTLTQYKQSQKKPSKYCNVRVTVDGISFQSKREAARWGELRILEAAGAIAALTRQVRFVLNVQGMKIGIYIADFAYIENGQRQIEDVKGRQDTKDVGYQLFRIKANLMKAIYGIEIREI